MKKFYIAGRTKNIGLIRKVAEVLEKEGLSWSFDWTKFLGVIPKPLPKNDTVIGQFAEKCIDGIKQADIFVLVAQDSLGSRGFFIELGVALTTPAEIWIIGDENPSVFSCLKRINHATTIDDFVQKRR